MTGYFTTIPLLPLNNIAPFTERDGTTYQQILREMRLAVIRIADAQVDLDAKMDVRLVQLNSLLDTLDGQVETALAAIRAMGDQYLPEMNLVYANLRNLADELEPLVETSRRLDQEIEDRQTAVATERTDRMAVDKGLREDADALRAYVELTMTKLPMSLYDSLEQGVEAAAATGKPLVLAYGSTLDVLSTLTIPDDVKIEGNGSTLNFPALVNQWVIDISDAKNVHLEGLKVQINNNGSPMQRGLRIINSDRCSLTDVSVNASQPGSGPGDGGSQNGVQVRDSSNITLDEVVSTNFDYSIWFNNVVNLTVDNSTVVNYKTGFWLRDTRDAEFNRCVTRGKSPNSDALPGHNGFILDAQDHGATEDITFTDCISNDAGEHGWRIGGFKRVSRINHVRCISRNTGRSGFKCLGGNQEDGSYHTDIDYDHCTVIDAAEAWPNRGGFMVEMSRNVTLDNPKTMRDKKTYACGEGLVLSGVTNVRVLNPMFLNTSTHGVSLRPDFGNITQVEIQGGLIQSAGVPFRIDYTGIELRRIKLTNHVELANPVDNYAISVMNEGGTGQVIGTSALSFYAANSVAEYVLYGQGNMSRFILDAKAPFYPWNIVQSGSMWQDTSYPSQGVAVHNGTDWSWV